MQFPQGGGQGPVLSDNMPKLSAGLTRGVNKTAVAYIVLVSLATIGMTLWVASNAFSADDDKKKQVTYEEVTVPNKPKLAVLPPPPPAEVVAKADLPPLPNDMPQMAEAQTQAPKDDLMQRRMASENNLVATQDKGKKNQLFEDEYSSVKRGAVEALANADFTLTRGTYIRCSLETKIVSTLPGMTSCIVTEPIYSVNGRRLLIDKGSKVTGEYKYADENYDRIGIVWTRVLTTTGLDVRIDSNGTDALGGAGVPGHYDGHWGERIGAALLVSLLADGIDAGAQRFANEHNIRGSTTVTGAGGVGVVSIDPWESATASTAKKAASDMLARSANRKATVTVLNGTVINIFTARDVDFSSVMR
ncbi:TrbI/VirB10 family protein [Hydrogenophaga pseudoflava]|uniref:TrbI/VirB10 family protein n=1 Tax=Hydrogenophaga pseudoflava TaxID=47421 RepID=UPI0027E44B1A|nr:TrbI/VirB10 family protein [Hydrogenophaga pseudoflava]MDQ7744274.1 TrbI/VirB10 family protein [Hydrogenophaga pseudoflava]